MRSQTLSPKHVPLTLTLPTILPRLEGLAILGAALAVYATQGLSWPTFALLLLAPDLSALGYLFGVQIGNRSYNLAHTLIFPLALGVAAGLLGHTLALQLALIWLAHIGMDRAVGYGFKDGDVLSGRRRAHAEAEVRSDRAH